MSPPLAATEKQKDAKTKVRRKKTMTPAAILASQTNGRLSRGVVTDRGKKRSRLNACKHNHRSELPILPGEDEDELKRRLEVWPQILGAVTEIEHLEAAHAVHMSWRRARSLRSDDADAERRMIALKKARVDGQAEEARRLGLELDSDDDPAGVVRKLHRSPEGCLLLLNEFTCLHNRILKYEILFWSQRERLFHLLGRRQRDLFTDDQTITDWMVALMGAVYGDAPPEEKVQSIGEVLEGLRPAWMDVIEYQVRIDHLVAAVAGREASIERVRSYLAAAIRDLQDRLKRAKARARRALKLKLESAWVDDTVAGARRLNYRLGHVRSYESSLKRLKKLQTERREEGGPPDDDPEDGIAPDETPAPEAGPVVETTEDGLEATGLGVGESDGTDTGVAATNAPSGKHEIRDPKSEMNPAKPGAPSPVRPLGRDESEPVFAAPNVGVGMGASVSAVDVTIDSSVSSASIKVNDPLPAAAENWLESDTKEPKSPLTEDPLLPTSGPHAPSPIRPLGTACEDADASNEPAAEAAVVVPAEEADKGVLDREPPTATPEPVTRVVVETVEGPGTAVEGGPAAADQPGRRWTDLVPLSACRRDGSLLPDDTPIPTPRSAAVPGVVTPSPAPIHDDPLVAMIEKYKNEFADLREFDHLE